MLFSFPSFDVDQRRFPGDAYQLAAAPQFWVMLFSFPSCDVDQRRFLSLLRLLLLSEPAFSSDPWACSDPIQVAAQRRVWSLRRTASS